MRRRIQVEARQIKAGDYIPKLGRMVRHMAWDGGQIRLAFKASIMWAEYQPSRMVTVERTV